MKKTKLMISNIANEDIITTSVAPCSCGSTNMHFYVNGVDGDEVEGSFYFWYESSQSWGYWQGILTSDYDFVNGEVEVGRWYVRGDSKYELSSVPHDFIATFYDPD